ncbi:MAG: acyl-CoA dehydratase activase [Planctomycetota bacterium]|nr:acyl-CoA dehydratase activase [Planctomycetota bacterium]
MISAGVDIGSTTTKVALMRDSELLAARIVPSGNLPGTTARKLYESTAEEFGVSGKVDVVATTGYGRRLASFGDIVMTEIKACVAGVLYGEHPDGPPRTVIDVGGQDTKVISLAEDGDIEDFSMNDKCAAGTGRFLEMLSGKLGMSYEQFVAEAEKADMLIHMNATCAVFAESEVVGLLAKNVSKANISAAAHDSIASRIASMVRRVGRRGPYSFVGGGAGNEALRKAVEENLNHIVTVPENHQAVVAIGAALEGARKFRKRMDRDRI